MAGAYVTNIYVCQYFHVSPSKWIYWWASFFFSLSIRIVLHVCANRRFTSCISFGTADADVILQYAANS